MRVPVIARLKSRWGRTTTVKDRLQVRLASGQRAMVWPVKEGLYVVAEVPDEGPDFGAVATVLAPLVIRSAAKAINAKLRNGSSDSEEEAIEPGRGSRLIARIRDRRTPRWVDQEDEAVLAGRLSR